jgi:PAS domain S-box-containing protein
MPAHVDDSGARAQLRRRIPRVPIDRVLRRTGDERTHRDLPTLPWLTAGVLLVATLALAATALPVRQLARAEARDLARADATAAATAAARAVRDGLDVVRANVDRAAGAGGVADSLAPGAECSLPILGTGLLAEVRIDAVREDGSVACSSRATPTRTTHADAAWLAGALTTGGTTGPVVDPRTERLAIVVSAPVVGGGSVVAFIDLATLGPTLAETFGGSRNAELIVTNDTTVLAHSSDPDSQLGRSSADAASGAESHGMISGEAPIPGTPWAVQARIDARAALAGADALGRLSFAIAFLGLAAVAGAVLAWHLAIARPLHGLRTAVRSATSDPRARPEQRLAPPELDGLREDLTALLDAAYRSRITAAELASILASSPEAIVTTDLSGTITSWNPGAQRLFGYERADAVGRELAMLAAAGTKERPGGLLAAVARGERVGHVKTRGRRADGTVLDVVLSAAPLRDASGTVTGVCALARDAGADTDGATPPQITLERDANQARHRPNRPRPATGATARSG